MAFGAKGWSLTRNEEDPLHFRQASVWDEHEDWERYWYSDEIAGAARRGGQLLQQAGPARLAHADRRRVDVNSPRAWPSLLTVLLFALALAALLSLAGTPQRAQAAPCPGPVSSNSAGVITIQGDPSCSYLEEDFRVVLRRHGQVRLRRSRGPVGPRQRHRRPLLRDLLGARDRKRGRRRHRSLRRHLRQRLHGDDAEPDRRRVSERHRGGQLVPRRDVRRGGRDFIQGGPGADAADGGAGEDLLQLRDAASDTGNCGDGFDAVLADAASLDALSGCEIVDRSPDPPRRRRRSARSGTTPLPQAQQRLTERSYLAPHPVFLSMPP